MKVTDFQWFDKRYGQWRVGYYMDEFLAINLAGIPAYLRKAWDVVGIISGHGKVRIGKSTFAQQIGYYAAWMISGGKMGYDEPTKRWVVVQKPKREVHFSMDHLVFSPKELMKKASYLYERYGRNQVIVYDEGRAGLDSARAMESINKAMQDFFQECGQYGHVILIVLPNFFKLHEDYATSRSIFLVDVYADENLQRGYFNFYNERQKEWLYFLGKKKIGNSIKYQGVRPSFSGRFTGFIPIDRFEYEAAKAAALKSKDVIKKEKEWKNQRDAAIYILKRQTLFSNEKIAKELSDVSSERVTTDMIDHLLVAMLEKRKILKMDDM